MLQPGDGVRRLWRLAVGAPSERAFPYLVDWCVARATAPEPARLKAAAEAMAAFTEPVRDWFGRAFREPTRVQRAAWPAIASGEHTLISAPTGAGQTLAAFLWALDRLAAAPQGDEDRKVRVVYVSPLKALSYDVERNLRAPLAGIQQATGAELEVGLRTGDTTQKERERMLRARPRHPRHHPRVALPHAHVAGRRSC